MRPRAQLGIARCAATQSSEADIVHPTPPSAATTKNTSVRARPKRVSLKCYCFYNFAKFWANLYSADRCDHKLICARSWQSTFLVDRNYLAGSR